MPRKNRLAPSSTKYQAWFTPDKPKAAPPAAPTNHVNFIQQALCALTSPDSYDLHPQPGIGPLVEVTINERFRLTALVDTGTTLRDRLTIVPAVSSAVETFTMLDGTELPTRGTVTLPSEHTTFGCLLDDLFAKWTPCFICNTHAKVL